MSSVLFWYTDLGDEVTNTDDEATAIWVTRLVCIFISNGNENSGVGTVQPVPSDSPPDWHS